VELLQDIDLLKHSSAVTNTCIRTKNESVTMAKVSSYPEKVLRGIFESYCEGLYQGGVEKSANQGAEFELFVADCILKLQGLTRMQIKSGIVGGERDGGIDAIYIWANENLISDEDDLEHYSEQINTLSKSSGKLKNFIKVQIIQAKLGSAYGSAVPMKIERTMRNYYGASKGKSSESYSPDLDNRLNLVTRTIESLIPNPKDISFEFIIASATDGMFDGQAREISEDVRKPIQEEYRGCEVSFSIYQPQELIDLAEKEDNCRATITTSQAYSFGSQYIFLVPTAEYFKTITEDGVIRDQLFDGNIRSYLGGRIENNSAIMASLVSFDSDKSDAVPFWWKNNGVTMTCSTEPQKRGDSYLLEDVQIVNGLQTSYTIYNYYQEHPERLNETKTESLVNRVVVKVISSTDENTRNEIISATNSQTPVDAASLRATDVIHREIESFFENSRDTKLVYDRRKGSAANRGVNSALIVQLPELAQAILSMGLLRPDDARARPGNALKKDDLYHAVFNRRDFSLESYLSAAEAMQRVQNVLGRTFKKNDANNVLWYVLMVANLARSKKPRSWVSLQSESDDPASPSTLSLKSKIVLPISDLDYSDHLIAEIAEEVLYQLRVLSDEVEYEEARVAKGKEFKLRLVQRVYDGRSKLNRLLNP